MFTVNISAPPNPIHPSAANSTHFTAPYTMSAPPHHLPIATLPALLALNQLNHQNVRFVYSETHGNSLYFNPTSAPLNETRTLLHLPATQVLSHTTLHEAAKSNSRLHRILEVLEESDFFTTERHILLIALALASRGLDIGGIWKDYTRYLPTSVPLPTTWSETEREWLEGTSLERPLAAKLLSLGREHADAISVTTNADLDIFYGGEGELSLAEYIHLDTLVRSRSLEVPGSGTCLVPIIDLANHDDSANAYFCYFHETTFYSISLWNRNQE